ncbi:MAG: hypothetical protein ABIL12_06810 [candidate division WOR-3 bacterium]
MLKVKGVLIKALNRMVFETYGKEGYYKVLKNIKRSTRGIFEKPVITQLYLADFYEGFLEGVSKGTGLSLKDIGRKKFDVIYEMLKPVFNESMHSYEDAIINASKISSHFVEGLEWRGETVEKNKIYHLYVKSPYRINTYKNFWESTLGFIEGILERLGAEKPKVVLESLGFNEAVFTIKIGD